MNMKSVDFEDFWTKLTEDDLWWDQIKVKYGRKDLRGIGNDCYIDLLAQSNRWKAQDYADFRKCYQKWLMYAKDAPVAPQLQQQVKEEPKEEVEIVTGQEREEWIKKWMDKVKEAPILKPVQQLSYKEIADEGDWLPKKPAPYPSTSESEVQKRLLHLQYIKENYDPRTQDRLPNWMSEEDWLQSKNT
jgi:hypothetical protein